MYRIGYYTSPPIYDIQHINIDTKYIDFNKYKPEHIFYISKLVPFANNSDKIQHLCIYSSEYPENSDKIIDTLGATCEKFKLDDLTLYDSMLVYMFNNPIRAQFDKEINYLFSQ